MGGGRGRYEDRDLQSLSVRTRIFVACLAFKVLVLYRRTSCSRRPTEYALTWSERLQIYQTEALCALRARACRQWFSFIIDRSIP